MDIYQYSLIDATTVFKDLISYKNMELYTLILTSPNLECCRYDNSDLILIYSPQGELVICAERVFFGSTTVRLKDKLVERIRSISFDKNINRTLTIKKDYMDIISYKRWWYKWAKRLL